MSAPANVGVVGLAAMGASLARNLGMCIRQNVG